MNVQELIQYRENLLQILLTKQKNYVYAHKKHLADNDEVIYPAVRTLTLNDERAIVQEMRNVTVYIKQKAQDD